MKPTIYIPQDMAVIDAMLFAKQIGGDLHSKDGKLYLKTERGAIICIELMGPLEKNLKRTS